MELPVHALRRVQTAGWYNNRRPRQCRIHRGKLRLSDLTCCLTFRTTNQPSLYFFQKNYNTQQQELVFKTLVQIQVPAFVFIHTHIYIYTNMCIYMHICTYTYINIYLYKRKVSTTTLFVIQHVYFLLILYMMDSLVDFDVWVSNN